ncbi:MAG: hypothetical protein JO332_02625 [Planctomycetaceae bacterium]|nr:hypothetical protein [Planctomycetaceae bacterium]
MGQEIVYCFKCQRRIVSADYAKGLAYQLENNSCCSSCAVEVLETLPARSKELLLAKMFKATQQKQSQTSGTLKALSSPPTSGSTRKVPILPAPPPPAPKSSAPLMAGLAAAAAVLILLVVTFSGSPPPPPPVVAEKRPPAPVGRPGPSPEEQRRNAAAKDAVQKARDFASAHPKELHGQVRQWRAALLEAERTGYEVEAKRELEKAEARVRDDLAELELKVRDLTGRKDFKAALDLVAQAKSQTPAAAADALERGIQEGAARAFAEAKEKALADRARGAKEAVESAKVEVARWGLPDYVEELKVALQGAWIPIFDGKTTAFLSGGSVPYWAVEDGALIHARGQNDRQAGQSREEFGDGEFRFRVSIRGAMSNWSINVRQQDGCCRLAYFKEAIGAMPEGEHEVIFTCRGSQVTATLDGRPQKVEVQHQVFPRGRLQWNSRDGEFRLLSVEYRPLP